MHSECRRRGVVWMTGFMWLALSGCGLTENNTNPPGGEAEVSVMNLTASEVTQTIVTITGAGIANPIMVPLAINNGKWSGVISHIPAGIHRTFALSALDASGTELYHGEATDVTIISGQLVSVVITAQQVATPTPYSNAAPVIDSLVASAVTVTYGEVVTLSVVAHDPNPTDTLTFTWSAGKGTFSSTASPTTTWTAPASDNTIKITIEVRDQKNAHAKLSLDVQVVAGNGQGKAGVTIHLNTWPVVGAVTADPSLIDAGQTTALGLVATDSDGDTLSYAWASDCLGTFSSSTVSSPSFALIALPTNNVCTFTVVVQDGKGGTDTGSLLIAAGSAPVVKLPPTVVSAYQSAEGAAPGESVTLQVQAYDPNGTALSFAWTASQGTLGTPNTTGDKSQIVWTAPATFTTTATIQVAIIDGSGQTTVHSMTVNSLALSWKWVNGPPLPVNHQARNIWATPENEVFIMAETPYVNGQVPETSIYHLKSGVWTLDLHVTGAQVAGLSILGTSATDVFAPMNRCQGGYGNCGASAASTMWHYNGVNWVEQSIPNLGANNFIQDMAGEANNVYATYGAGILHFNGTSWSIASTSGDVGYGPLSYIGPNEMYTVNCWGYQAWNGTTWTNYRGFDFCDVSGLSGVRTDDGSLQLWAVGSNNFANGIRAWQFSENPKGSGAGSWGSKYATYINDVLNFSHGTGIWASGPNNFWVVGNINNNTEGRIWHWDGTTWTRDLTSPPLTSSTAGIYGTSATDIWVLLLDGRLLHYSR